jgi:hypothetical protein
MAIEYALIMEALAAPEVVMERLRGTSMTTGLRIRAETVRPMSVPADLNFHHPVWITFRLDKFGDIAAQQDAMVEITSSALDLDEGDAVLHFQSEVIWLWRRDGRLLVNDADDIWPPGRLALLTRPFERAALTPRN